MHLVRLQPSMALLIATVAPLHLPAQAPCSLQLVAGDAVAGVDGSIDMIAPWDPDGPGPAPLHLHPHIRVAGLNRRFPKLVRRQASRRSEPQWPTSTVAKSFAVA